MDPISKFVMEHVIDIVAQLVMPLMLLTFVLGVSVRMMIYYVAAAQGRFAQEFEKRVQNFFSATDVPKVHSFSRLSRILLDKTYFETIETRNKYKRRNLDHIQGLMDRVFLVQDGLSRLINDVLRHARYMKKDNGPAPKFVETSKGIFDNNPYFNRLVGVMPVGLLNELVNILPGLFIIGGIFGTFLGISKGLPDLGTMDLSNMEETKRVMDIFLVKISQAMIKSIIGIGFSVLMSLINTLFSAEGVYYNLINRFSSALEHIWNETTTNELEVVEPPKKPENRAA